MNMKRNKNCIAASLIGGTGVRILTAANAADAKKPNIVFILMDNLGYGELGCYGGGILRGAATPRIDKLATEGSACSTSTSRRNARRAARPS